MQHQRTTLSSRELPAHRASGENSTAAVLSKVRLTFVSEAFEQRHVVQAQHLTDVHPLGQKGQLLRRIPEEKISFSKRRRSEELEALLLSSSPAKQGLDGEIRRLQFGGQEGKAECLVCRQEVFVTTLLKGKIRGEWGKKTPVLLVEVCEQPCES